MKKVLRKVGDKARKKEIEKRYKERRYKKTRQKETHKGEKREQIRL